MSYEQLTFVRQGRIRKLPRQCPSLPGPGTTNEQQPPKKYSGIYLPMPSHKACLTVFVPSKELKKVLHFKLGQLWSLLTETCSGSAACIACLGNPCSSETTNVVTTYMELTKLFKLIKLSGNCYKVVTRLLWQCCLSTYIGCSNLE